MGIHAVLLCTYAAAQTIGFALRYRGKRLIHPFAVHLHLTGLAYSAIRHCFPRTEYSALFEALAIRQGNPIHAFLREE